ncbi:MobF family relaxase [Kribbella lupini]|uniref:TrwC relaxase domain-containing protein n=1 Tax=Kribbella lupini TaxID=291602 RepID=A0ABN2B015_9ACTN
MLTVSSGHSADYLTGAVAAGRENYYTGATAAGEPPGRWSGRGAEALGLSGEVGTEEMSALYERFLDPRDERFGDPMLWDEADTLGHTGRAYKSEEEIYQAALAAEPGADAERREELRAEAGRNVRRNVAFYDATFSVQKSITVLHTSFEAQEVRAVRAAEQARAALPGAVVEAERSGDRSAVHRLQAAVQRAQTEALAWGQQRQAVEDAIWAGNQALLGYLSDKAGYTRVGHHGGAAGRWADAHDWTVASFFQHDSRNHDPQLHIHNAILNRVQGPDGEWRTIDGAALHRYRGAAGAIGERVMEQHLTQALGVRFAMRPDGKSREIVGVDQAVMDLFSSRRRAITKKTARLVDEFRDKFGREPNGLELDRLQRSATFATRKAKSHDGETVEDRLERWDRELRAEVSGGLAAVAEKALQHAEADRAAQPLPEAKVVEEALAEVQATKAAWTAADLTRAISNRLPDDLGNRTPAEIVELLDTLTERALERAWSIEAARPGDASLPDELRLNDGSSAYRAPGGERFMTAAHRSVEESLAELGYARGAAAMNSVDAAGFVNQLATQGFTLGRGQDLALRGILTSGAKVEALIGPAGTGKSRVVGALAKAWEDPALWGGRQQRMVGLAASQAATEVLAGDGVTARNITRWLMTQDKIANGTANREQLAWALRDGDLVVVDESAMAETADLAAIQRHCEAAGAKLLLVGDPRQLAAVGAGGGMELVTKTALTHELGETHRFQQDWEGPASLRLRAGDASVLAEYYKYGRIIDGEHAERAQRLAADAWLADHLKGLNTLLVTDTNEQAASVAAELRARLVKLRRVDDLNTVELGGDGNRAGRGDLIQARMNDWQHKGEDGTSRPVFNRDEFRVEEILVNGSIRAIPLDRDTRQPIEGQSVILPSWYVQENVTLAYAATVHAAQGATVDTTHGVVSARTSLRSLYVQLTRGRISNTVHVVTKAAHADAETGEVARAARKSATAVLAAAFDADEAAPESSGLQAEADDAADAGTYRTAFERLTDAITVATGDRTAQWLQALEADDVLTPDECQRLIGEDGAATLSTLLRRVELAGVDAEQVLRDAIAKRSLEGARQLTSVLQDRITRTTELDPTTTSLADLVPATVSAQWSTYLHELAAEADKRHHQLGEAVADEQPQWALEALGPVPGTDSPGAETDRATWVERAAAVAAHREIAGITDPAEALGSAPKPGQPEMYATWRQAWRALGRPEADRAEAEMTTGQLRVRVRAYDREQTWAPPYVAHELAGTRAGAEDQRREATRLRAEAAALSAEGVDRVHELQVQAAEAEALAEALDARAAELQLADDARATWYAHTAETRAAAQRAADELATRGIDNTDDGPTVDDWIAANLAADRAEDPHRVITDELDLTEIAAQQERDRASAVRADEFVEAELVHDQLDTGRDDAEDIADESISDAEIVAEPNNTDQTDPVETQSDFDKPTANTVDDLAPADLRDVAAAEDHAPEAESMRIPTADETADAVRRAQRALIELRQREQADAEREAAEADRREEDLAAWHAEREFSATDATSNHTQAGDSLGLDD